MDHINIYCDESCHLEHDDSDIMIIGSMFCGSEYKRKIYDDIREIKAKYHLNTHYEIKWTKVSLSKIDFFLELVKYFWKCEELHYRGLIATGKSKLNHDKYNGGDYDLWYYKMYYYMLAQIIQPESQYHIMIDIKDTHGGKRVEKLRDVLCNNIYDYKKDVVKQIIQINSRESDILQLADLINGALAYYHRGLYNTDSSNQGKNRIIQELINRTDIDHSSSLNNTKFNLFIWQPRNER